MSIKVFQKSCGVALDEIRKEFHLVSSALIIPKKPQLSGSFRGQPLREDSKIGLPEFHARQQIRQSLTRIVTPFPPSEFKSAGALFKWMENNSDQNPFNPKKTPREAAKMRKYSLLVTRNAKMLTCENAKA